MTKKTWNRILIAGIILVILVILILALWELPGVKAVGAKSAVIGFWFVIGLQLIVLAQLSYSLIFSFTEGHFENGLLVGAGFIALFLGLMLSDAAFSGGQNILLFVCLGCDLVTAILAFIARYFRGRVKTGAAV